MPDPDLVELRNRFCLFLLIAQAAFMDTKINDFQYFYARLLLEGMRDKK